MRVVILTPWRTDHGPREAIWRHVHRQQLQLGVEVFTGDSDTDPFNICGAWNIAARAAGRWDVALFWGADFTLEDRSTALVAAVEAAKGYPYVFAFDRVVKLNFTETTRHHEDASLPVRDDPLPFGGIRAVNRAWWDKVGGYDERFQGWGHGDRAFVHVLRRHGGTPSRVPGRMVMHRHPGRAHKPGDAYYAHQAANMRLLREYETG